MPGRRRPRLLPIVCAVLTCASAREQYDVEEGAATVAQHLQPEDEGDVNQCGLDFYHGAETWVKASGVPFQRTDYLAVHVQAFEKCAEVPGNLVRLTFDARAYFSRDVERRAEERSDFNDVRDFFLKKVRPEELDQSARGVSLCVPRSCRQEYDLIDIARLYIGCAVTATCDSLDVAPRPGSEMNITLIGAPEASAWQDHGSGPDCGVDCRVPWWLSCTGQRELGEWRHWMRLVAAWLGPAPAAGAQREGGQALPEPPPELVEEADRLVSKAAPFADLFFAWMQSQFLESCNSGVDHGHFEDPESQWPVSPGVQHWKEEAAFCPHAYVAALTVLAAVRSRLGLLTSASDDLKRLRAALGGCRPFDAKEQEDLQLCAVSLQPLRQRAPLDPDCTATESSDAERAQRCAGRIVCRDRMLAHSAKLLQSLVLFEPAEL
mmetsp:Transcript_45786/g.146974  ORF Transcript_45786/g.146974 Transcript_45786/m.146974 type:complete len:435 (-) Transcript_45786:53-1357(-)